MDVAGNLATLGLRVDNGQAVAAVDQTTKKLDGLAAAGARAQGAMLNFSKSSGSVSAANTNVASTFSQTEQAIVRTTAAHEKHALATGKAIRALEGLSVEALGANHQLATLGVVLSEFAAGHAAVLVALAAVAAGAKAYEILGEETKKAAEEQEKLSGALLAWSQQGSEAERQIAAMRDRIKELREELEKMEGGNIGAVAKGVGIAGFLRTLLAGGGLQSLSQLGKEIADAMAKAATGINEGTEAIEKKQRAEAQDLATMALEIEKQNALNAAFDKGELALSLLNIEYEARQKHLEAAAKHDGVEPAAMKALIDLWEQGATKAARLNEYKRLTAELDKLWLDTSTKVAESLDKMTVKVAANANAWKDDAAAILHVSNVSAPSVAKSLNDSTSAALAGLDAYDARLQAIFQEGFDKIATTGLKSFHDFFAEVLTMFQHLMKEMEDYGTQSDVAYKLLGIGRKGITAALGGFQIGQQSGSDGTGIVGGAMTGFAVGGPWGAAVGALAGAAGGLMSAAKEQKEAAAAFKSQFQSNYVALLQQGVQAGTVSERALAVVQARTAADQLYDSIEKNLAGLKNQAEREKELALVRQNETIIVAKINEEYMRKEAMDQQSLQLQILQLQGRDDDARSLQHAIELEQALTDKRSDEYMALLKQKQALEDAIAATKKANDEFFRLADAAYAAVVAARTAAFQASLGPADITANRNDFTSALSDMASKFTAKYNEQIRVAQDQLKVLTDSQKTAKQSHDDTAKALASLVQFRGSLDVGQFSTLSPFGAVTAARGQLDALFRSAQLGDKEAAGQFGQSANTYLALLRDYGASGSTFVGGQADVKRMADALITQYGVQQSIDQQMLDSSTQQVDLLTQQVELAQRNVEAVQRAAQGISDLYDKMFGGATQDAASVWARLLGNALTDITGANPGVPIAPTPSFFPFGNANSAQVTVAERLMFAIFQALHNGGIPGFATGGDFGGGLMQVGERGPELVASGRARVFTAQQLTGDTTAEVRALRAEVRALRAVLADGLMRQIDATVDVADKVSENTTATRRVMDAIKAVVA